MFGTPRETSSRLPHPCVCARAADIRSCTRVQTLRARGHSSESHPEEPTERRLQTLTPHA